MSKKKSVRKREALARYRVRYTETVCWEVIVQANDEGHAKDIVDAGGDEALAHRSPRWKHAEHQIEMIELIDED
jgi:hypothetical protein